MMNADLRILPDAVNPHVRIDAGEGASVEPRRGCLPCITGELSRAIRGWAMFAFAVGISVAHADTLAWFHFDEREPGTVIGGDGKGVLSNAVNSAMAVRAIVLEGASNVSPEKYPTYAPTFVTPHRGIQVYDPVSGAKFRNRAALQFKTGTTSGQSGGYYGGAVRVAGTDTSANPTDAFTIECFVCTTGGVFKTFAPIFGKRNNGLTEESWALYMTTNGKLEARLRTSGNTSATYSGTSGQGDPINDGSWHHVAYVYDKTDGIARVFLDYSEAFTFKTKAGTTGETVSYYSDSANLEWAGALYVGGYPYNDNGCRKFNGCIDEFRISDVALTPAQFLRLQPEDDDEIVRLRFDPQNYGVKQISVNGNYNDRLDLPAKLTRGDGVDGSATTISTATRCAEKIRDGYYAAAETNGGAMNLATNGAGLAGYIKVAGMSNRIHGGTESNVDFTVELFFRTRKTILTGPKQTIFKIGGTPDGGAVLHDRTDGRITYTFNKNKEWGGLYSPEKTACDGNWHHLAAVCDASRKQMRFYFDGKLSCCSNGATNILENNVSLFVGRDNGSNQYFDGYIDEVRVMKRALKPEEFLSTHAVAGMDKDDPTVAFVNFENDYTTSPYPDLIGAGNGRAHGETGAAPVFQSHERTYLLDGSNGVTTVDSKTYVACNDSVITWPSSPLFEQPSFTVEFFANLSRFEKSGNLVRYTPVSDVSGNPVWALFHPNGNSNILRLRIQLVQNGISEANYDAGWTINPLTGDGWHHYALTVIPDDTDDAKTKIEFFRDHVSLGVKIIPGRLDYSPSAGGGCLAWGASSADNKTYAKLDALRFSRGVLDPGEFLYKKKIGMTILVSRRSKIS